MARRRIVDDRKEKRECEKEGGKERKVPGYSWLEIHRQLSFLVVIRVWRERSGTAGRNTRNRDGRRDAGRILRSACKPISISAEIRLSEFPVASGPRGSPRFIGPGSLEFYSLPAKTGPWPTDQTKRFATPDSPVYETHALSIQRTRATAISASFIASTLWINKLREGRDHGGVDLSSSIWPFRYSFVASYTTVCIKVRRETWPRRCSPKAEEDVGECFRAREQREHDPIHHPFHLKTKVQMLTLCLQTDLCDETMYRTLLGI